MRLDLAQYRELEAFAKFGSDLDKSTLQQLRRGERLVEILKQKQYTPIPVEKQILIIYAASKGFLDEVPVNELARYEREVVEQCESLHNDILTGIREKKELTAEITEKLDKFLKEFTERFKSTVK